MPSPPFDDVVARARAGEAPAWADLYDEVGSLVVGYLRAQRLPDPEDVAGEVFLQMVRDLHRFTGDRDRFRSWVLTIAHHRLIDERRRAARRPTVPLPDHELRLEPSDDPEHEVLSQVGVEELQARLQILTEDQRTVLLLRVVGDLSLREVAETMGKRVGAIKGLQHRAVETLRRELAKDPDPTSAPTRRQRA
jgi:RNA polymerase sigma factor (sigma-70 family)